MPETFLQSKKTFLSGATTELEEELRTRNLTAISLVALGNLASTESRVADHIASSTILRDIVDTLAKDPNIHLRQQFSRVLANLAAHNNPVINKRIQTKVGLDGFKVILRGSDPSVQFNIARAMTAMVCDSK